MNTEEDDEFKRIQMESGWRKRQIALDQKAENAKELGLDYEQSEKPKKWVGFDDCVIGVASIWRDQSIYEVLVYSGDSMVELLLERDSMTDEEAIEFISFKIENAYIGVNTPVIAWKNEDWDEE